MMRARHNGGRQLQNSGAEAGFTLIELLVVVIVLGLLAAIAIPLFVVQREKAHDAAATADVAQLGKEVVTWFVDHDEAPVLTQDRAGRGYLFGEHKVAAASADVALHPSTVLTSRDDWCVAVVNERGGTSAGGLRYSAAGGFGEGVC